MTDLTQNTHVPAADHAFALVSRLVRIWTSGGATLIFALGAAVKGPETSARGDINSADLHRLRHMPML